MTTARLARDLRALGLEPGGVLLVHASLKSIGWVCGAECAVIEALIEVLGEGGTLVMPAHTPVNSDPANWCNPPVPEAWWESIRASMPAFDPEHTPCKRMGAIAEVFRRWRGTRRSDHPMDSFAARGPVSETILREHELLDGLGEGSPLQRLYELDASILLLGVGHGSNTSLHLAERKALGDEQAQVRKGCAMLVGGLRQWVSFREPEVSAEDFETVGEAFERQDASTRRGAVGQAPSRLLALRPLVDFAVPWFRAHRARAS